MRKDIFRRAVNLPLTFEPPSRPVVLVYIASIFAKITRALELKAFVRNSKRYWTRKMHAVLQNSSLLLEIFYFIGNRKSNLLSACLTCKTFLQPARDLLWRDLLVLQHPTMICMSIPRIKSRPFGQGSDFREYYIDAPLSDADITRMREYTRRVRVLPFHFLSSVETDTTDSIHPCLSFRIMSLLRGKALFPNLSALHLRGNVDVGPINLVEGISLYLPHLLSPHLNQLSVRVHGSINAVSLDVLNFISDLGHQSAAQPRLTRLEFSHSPNVPLSIKILSPLRFLEHLDLAAPVPDFSFIQALVSLEHLRSVSLSLVHLTVPRYVLRGSTRSFLCLKSLTLKSLCNPHDLDRLFEHVAILSLHTIKVNTRDLGTFEWDGHLSIFAKHFPNLRCFTIGSCYSEGEQPTRKIPWSACTALLRLRHLTQLVIKRPCITLLSHENVIEMIAAWPQVKHLSVAVWDVSPNMDHTTLHKIAKGLPNLINLEFPLFLSQILSRDPTTSQSSCNNVVSKLQTLKLKRPVWSYSRMSLGSSKPIPILPSDWDVRTIHCLARYIDNLFPGLKVLQAQCESLDESRGHTLLQEFRRCMAETRVIEGEKRRAL
ncbi:hypothetical protein BJ165DRAFT_391794 [Panaeolus papilionaceus]|nr:hypothetical protein BJ165DRAFT_391794 [Panaeolus papilionaceus]